MQLSKNIAMIDIISKTINKINKIVSGLEILIKINTGLLNKLLT